MRCRIAGRVRIRRDEFPGRCYDRNLFNCRPVGARLARWRHPRPNAGHKPRAPPRAGRSWRRVRGRASRARPLAPRARPLARAISVSRFGPVARRERLARLRVAPPRTRATLSPPSVGGRSSYASLWTVEEASSRSPPFGTPPRPVVSRFTARAPPRTAHSSCSPPRTPATTTATPRPSRRHPPRCSPRPPTTHP